MKEIKIDLGEWPNVDGAWEHGVMPTLTRPYVRVNDGTDVHQLYLHGYTYKVSEETWFLLKQAENDFTANVRIMDANRAGRK